MLRPLLFRLAEDRLLTILLLLLPLLLWAIPTPPMALFALVQWPTIIILCGLILLSRGMEDSGFLSLAGEWLLTHLHNARSLAGALVLFCAALSTLLTNDVTLFIVVPLTLALGRVRELPIGRLVIFEALAVNAGSSLSPIGNPQNLFLWQSSGAGFIEFVLVMLPLSLLLLVLILLAIPWAFGPARLPNLPVEAPRPLNRTLFLTSLLLYAPFLLAAEFGLVHWLLPLLLGVYTWRFRAVIWAMDWPLLLLFVLMFIDLGLLARLPVLQNLTQSADTLPGGMLTAGAWLSQGISNVPAAIFLAGSDAYWPVLAWGVNIGGLGLATASLANLIALRMTQQPGLWREFHYWSVPMFLLAWLLGMLLNAKFPL